MKWQRIDNCSLERMIGFIIEVNQIEKLQFALYIARVRKKIITVDDQEIFTYGENKRRETWTLPVGASICSGWIKDIEQRSFREEEAENLGLVSQVEPVNLVNEGIKHIPMIDFDCVCSSQNLQKAIDVIFSLGEEKGFLVESGNSYHYYGINLLSEEKWHDFMKGCQEQEIIGKDWPFFQMEAGSSILRISTSSAKPHLPQVIAKIGNFVL